MDVFEYMMKLEKNLYLPDFALSLHVLVCQKKNPKLNKPKHSHFNGLSSKLLLIKPSCLLGRGSLWF